MSVAKVIPLEQRRSTLRVVRKRKNRERRGFAVSRRWMAFRSMDRLYILLAGLGGMAAGVLLSLMLLR